MIKERTTKSETIDKEAPSAKGSLDSTVPRRLTRSNVDKVFAGVAGGLAQYLELDSTLIRIIFILIAVFGGSGVLIYLILWLVMPNETSVAQSSEAYMRENVAEFKEKAHSLGQEFRRDSKDHSGRPMWGILLFVFGVVFLAQNYGFLHNFDIGRLWPVILIGLGLMLVVRK